MKTQTIIEKHNLQLAHLEASHKVQKKAEKYFAIAVGFLVVYILVLL